MMNESKLLSPNGIVKASALCLLMSAFSVNAAFAVPVLDREVMVIQQGRTLTGTVVDNFGDPVIGANVIVKGTTIGNITDVNGTFTVENVPDDAVLQISYIGFKTLEVPVKGQTTFNINIARRHRELARSSGGRLWFFCEEGFDYGSYECK